MASLTWTPAEIARAQKRIAESQKVIARAAQLPREQCEQVCGAYLEAPTRRTKRQIAHGRGPLRSVATSPPRPRAREYRPRQTRRSSSSSRTSSADPPADPEPGLRHISAVLADYLNVQRGLARNHDGWTPCPFCGQPIVEELDGDHCGGCAITWWRQ